MRTKRQMVSLTQEWFDKLLKKMKSPIHELKPLGRGTKFSKFSSKR